MGSPPPLCAPSSSAARVPVLGAHEDPGGTPFLTSHRTFRPSELSWAAAPGRGGLFVSPRPSALQRLLPSGGAKNSFSLSAALTPWQGESRGPLQGSAAPQVHVQAHPDDFCRTVSPRNRGPSLHPGSFLPPAPGPAVLLESTGAQTGSVRRSRLSCREAPSSHTLRVLLMRAVLGPASHRRWPARPRSRGRCGGRGAVERRTVGWTPGR